MRRSVKSQHVAEPAAVYGSDRGEVVPYRAPDGTVALDIRLERETLWLNLSPIAGLFVRDKAVGRALPDAVGVARPTCQATRKPLNASVNLVKKRNR